MTNYQRLIVRERTDKSYELGIVNKSTNEEFYFHKFYYEEELHKHVNNYRQQTGILKIDLENTIGKVGEPILAPAIENPHNNQPFKDMPVKSIKEVGGLMKDKPLQKEGMEIKHYKED